MKLLITVGVVYMIYILRRSVAKFLLWKKKKQNLPKIHPVMIRNQSVLPNNSIQNNFNNAALNSGNPIYAVSSNKYFLKLLLFLKY